MRPVIGIIGAGKVGCTLGSLLHRAGYNISCVSSRTIKNAQSLANQLGAQHIDKSNLGELVQQTNLVIISVPDDAISEVVQQLTGYNWHEKAVIHTSGAKGSAILSELESDGAMTGSFHPIFPFSNVAQSIQLLAGSTIALEAEHPKLRQLLVELVDVLVCNPIFIPQGKKALYHAALVLASNYVVTLYAVAEQLLVDLGADRISVDQALNSLIVASTNNIVEQGIPDALTGPLSRADLSTITAHLEAFSDETLATAYRSLARLSYPMLAQRGVDTAQIEKVLQDQS